MNGANFLCINQCVTEAFSVLEKPLGYANIFINDVQVYSWPQMWGSTNCGFGGIGGQAFTEAQTVVIIGPIRDAAVFHNGRLAYHVVRPNEEFWEDFKKMKLKGASRYENRDYEHVDSLREIE